MAPTKRKRSVKKTKSSALVEDSSTDSGQPNPENLDKLHPQERDGSDDDQPLLETAKLRKKKKTVTISEDEHDASVVGSSITNAEAVIEDVGASETVLNMPTPLSLSKAKKPAKFQLRQNSALADNSQTGRRTKVNPIDKDSEPSKFAPAISSDQTGNDSSGLSMKQANISEDNKKHSFFDSDIDDSGLDDSDDMHSAHSLESGTPTKKSSKALAKHGDRLYLDSFPDIADSGIKRNKDIQNNPFTLDEDIIEPLLRDDYKTLPSLRHACFDITF
ncbi:hypothetical protein F5887DRAFT_1079946 [Amanita rubescens]|nr:hypothetical protein F5887DRAFT_1079946 [Amanita rubescens]